MTTSNLILSDRIPSIDQQQPNRLTKSIFIKKWLADFARQNHRPHYSDRFVFGSLVSESAQGGTL